MKKIRYADLDVHAETIAVAVAEGGATGYRGLVASEHFSGNKVHRGPITKSGNAHLRRVLVESSWSYHHRPNKTGFLLRRQKSLALSDEVKAIAWKAQHRLNKRYKTLAAKGNLRKQQCILSGQQRRRQRGFHEKENPGQLLCGTGCGPDPRIYTVIYRRVTFRAAFDAAVPTIHTKEEKPSTPVKGIDR